MAVASYSIYISSMYILLLYILVSVLNNDLKAVFWSTVLSVFFV